MDVLLGGQLTDEPLDLALSTNQLLHMCTRLRDNRLFHSYKRGTYTQLDSQSVLSSELRVDVGILNLSYRTALLHLHETSNAHILEHPCSRPNNTADTHTRLTRTSPRQHQSRVIADVRFRVGSRTCTRNSSCLHIHPRHSKFQKSNARLREMIEPDQQQANPAHLRSVR